MKKVLIWGTGKVATSFLKEIREAEIIGFIESKRKNTTFLDKPIFQPEQILSIKFDILVIASSYVDDINTKCKQIGISENKIIYLRNHLKINDLNENISILEDVVKEKYFTELLGQGKYLILQRMNYDTINESEIDKYITESYKTDYSRYRTFELVADMLNNDNIEGDIAEVGVNVGTFAQIINSKFSDRSLYLFDTFDSFDENENKKEVEKGNCDNEFIEVFKNTSVELVLNSMPYPEKCIIKQGYFPETAIGLETTFAFVSIDVDFEESIYNSLEYFYPRLIQGGYLFVHDFNNNFLFGVKKAIKRYEDKYGMLKKIPLSDNGGTLIVVK